MIHPQFGANSQTGERFRNWWLEVDTDCERAISCLTSPDGAWIDGRLTIENTDGIMRIGKLRGKEALGIAPDFATNLCRDPVVNNKGQVLCNAIRASICAVVMSVVDIGDGGEFIANLPCRCYCVQITEVVIVIWSFGTNVGGSGDHNLAFVEIQSDAAVECGRVVIVVDARVHAARPTRHDIEPLGRVQSEKGASMVEWDREIEDVGVRVERISPGI